MESDSKEELYNQSLFCLHNFFSLFNTIYIHQEFLRIYDIPFHQIIQDLMKKYTALYKIKFNGYYYNNEKVQNSIIESNNRIYSTLNIGLSEIYNQNIDLDNFYYRDFISRPPICILCKREKFNEIISEISFDKIINTSYNFIPPLSRNFLKIKRLYKGEKLKIKIDSKKSTSYLEIQKEFGVFFNYSIDASDDIILNLPTSFDMIKKYEVLHFHRPSSDLLISIYMKKLKINKKNLEDNNITNLENNIIDNLVKLIYSLMCFNIENKIFSEDYTIPDVYLTEKKMDLLIIKEGLNFMNNLNVYYSTKNWRFHNRKAIINFTESVYNYESFNFLKERNDMKFMNKTGGLRKIETEKDPFYNLSKFWFERCYDSHSHSLLNPNLAVLIKIFFINLLEKQLEQEQKFINGLLLSKSADDFKNYIKIYPQNLKSIGLYHLDNNKSYPEILENKMIKYGDNEYISLTNLFETERIFIPLEILGNCLTHLISNLRKSKYIKAYLLNIHKGHISSTFFIFEAEFGTVFDPAKNKFINENILGEKIIEAYRIENKICITYLMAVKNNHIKNNLDDSMKYEFEGNVLDINFSENELSYNSKKITLNNKYEYWIIALNSYTELKVESKIENNLLTLNSFYLSVFIYDNNSSRSLAIVDKIKEKVKDKTIGFHHESSNGFYSQNTKDKIFDKLTTSEKSLVFIHMSDSSSHEIYDLLSKIQNIKIILYSGGSSIITDSPFEKDFNATLNVIKIYSFNEDEHLESISNVVEEDEWKKYLSS